MNRSIAGGGARLALGALALAWCGLCAALPAPSESGIAWTSGDPDGAFARARTERKPLFLYWGATWCPPCNQVKATIFRQREFIERSRQFIAVYVDGDEPNAQALADRFHVVGYPTMILFSADAREITRLPGEIDPAQYLYALSLGLGSGRTARATLHAALAPGARGVSAQEWTLLANYSWDTDEGQLVAPERLASVLAALAQACPPSERASADRLALRAMVAAAASPLTAEKDRGRSLTQVREILKDPARARAVYDLLVEWPAQIVGTLTDPHAEARQELVELWDARLAAFAADPAFSTAERLDALTARVSLQRLLDPNAPLARALVQTIKSAAEQADRNTTDRFERQSVISSAGDALSAAGLDAQSDALLQAELTRSASPYYFMLELAVNARKRGDTATSLDWYQKAYAAAQGPATRLQWGTRYVIATTELAPEQPERIEHAAEQVLNDLPGGADPFHGRNRLALQKMGAALQAWNAAHQHDASVQEIEQRVQRVCAKLPDPGPERNVCERLLHPASGM